MFWMGFHDSVRYQGNSAPKWQENSSGSGWARAKRRCSSTSGGGKAASGAVFLSAYIFRARADIYFSWPRLQIEKACCRLLLLGDGFLFAWECRRNSCARFPWLYYLSRSHWRVFGQVKLNNSSFLILSRWHPLDFRAEARFRFSARRAAGTRGRFCK